MNKKDHRHLNLLCDIGELAALLAGSEDIENFLQKTVEMVARHTNVNACSIYLFDAKSNELVLKANSGLESDPTGKARYKIGEGLIGLVFEKSETVPTNTPRLDSGLINFNDTDKGSLGSLLAVPVRRGAEKIGVLAVHHQEQDFFNEIDTLAMRAIASQLAGAVGNARLLTGHANQIGSRKDVDRILEISEPLTGQVASYGFAFAPATVFDKSQGLLVSVETGAEEQYTLPDFHRAVRETTDQLRELQSRFAQRMAEGASLIFSAHLMILKDKRFFSEMEKLIRNGESVPSAVKRVAGYYIGLYESSDFEHIRDKANDVRDLAGRILKNLEQRVQVNLNLSENRIIIAPELYPSDVLRLASEDIKGIILIRGGMTSHVAIIARSLQMPMIIVNLPELLLVPNGTPAIIDAESRTVYIEPSEEVIRQFKTQKKNLLDTATLSRAISPVTYTSDGIRVRLMANINLLSDLAIAHDLKAEGIGLYRTEFPFLVRSAVPSEEEQFHVYRRLFEEMADKEVTIRVLDVGSDKLRGHSDNTTEANPALGLRAMRFMFRHRDIFNQQLRAILRAAVNSAKPRIMLPMISSLDDFIKARQMVYECKANLEREYIPHHRKPLVGALIELPCLIEIMDELAAEADFLSIGTNDLIQYLLAADRTNEKVAEYYQPCHPAVLRSLAKIVSTACYRNTGISVCGELAHDPQYIPFLLGIGIRNLSVYPNFLPAVQKTIGNLKLSDAKIYANRLLGQSYLTGTKEVMQRLSKVWFK